MTNTYGYGAQPQGGITAGSRDAITQALMANKYPPPVSPASLMVPPPQAGPVAGMPAMPQAQPAAGGPPGPPTGAMGPIGGPYQQGLNLPGVMPPGQLPTGMNPQNVMGTPPAGPTAMVPPGGLRSGY